MSRFLVSWHERGGKPVSQEYIKNQDAKLTSSKPQPVLDRNLRDEAVRLLDVSGLGTILQDECFQPVGSFTMRDTVNRLGPSRGPTRVA